MIVAHNHASSIAAAIESVLAQGYSPLQIAVEDTGSTDGTSDIVRSYGSGVEMRLAAGTDPGAALRQGLARSSGDMIGICLADGWMAPGATHRAAGELSTTADAGAITGDSLLCDSNGNVMAVQTGQPFDLLAYLLGEQRPDLTASFFRRQSLDDIGLFTDPWDARGFDSMAFELWCRLGTEHQVRYVPHRFNRRIDRQGTAATLEGLGAQVTDRLQLCERYLFGPGTFFGNHRQLRASILNAQREVVAGQVHVPAGDALTGRAHLAHEVATLYRDRGQLDEAIAAGERCALLRDETIDGIYLNFALASPSFTDRELEAGQTQWAATHANPSRLRCDEDPLLQADRPTIARHTATDRPLKVGYNGTLWGIQTGLAILNPVIAAHDRARIHVVGYCPLEQPRTVTDLFDEFHFTGSMNHQDFCRFVRGHDLDVLVETNGFSHGNRIPALAARCAPVQVAYVNHMATTGVPNIDYLITDRSTIGRVDQAYFTEQLYPLDRCFLTYTYRDMWAPPVAAPPFLRNGFVTFGNFGSPSKLNPECLKLWALVLHRTPGAKLLLRNPGMDRPGNIAFIRKRFSWLGIDAERLIILPGADRHTILANYESMDICLDSWPYCGGNTTAEALWQGVPVVTLKGNRLASAYGASLVEAAGLGDLVAHRAEEFGAVASALAIDHDRLVALRKSLRDDMVIHGLSDPKAMATALENAYVDMARRKNPTSREQA